VAAVFNCFILDSESSSEPIGALSFLTQESRFSKAINESPVLLVKERKIFYFVALEPAENFFLNKTVIFVKIFVIFEVCRIKLPDRKSSSKLS
jgi:hypothetical protein